MKHANAVLSDIDKPTETAALPDPEPTIEEKSEASSSADPTPREEQIAEPTVLEPPVTEPAPSELSTQEVSIYLISAVYMYEGLKLRSHCSDFCSDFPEVGNSDFEQEEQFLDNLFRATFAPIFAKFWSDAPILASQFR